MDNFVDEDVEQPLPLWLDDKIYRWDEDTTSWINVE